MDKKRILPYTALLVFAAQLLLMIVSWLLSAAFPTGGYRALLSSEGLRWFLGRFSDNLSTPLLVWIVLLSVAYGCCRGSGIFGHLSTLAASHTFRERRALLIAFLLLAVCAGIVVLLTVPSHAVLLSATGSLWPSPFSASLVPLVAFCLTLCACGYGVIAGRLQTVADAYEAMMAGLRAGAPVLLFYVLLTQLVESAVYVFATVLP
ncbi:MAG: AbgT family transporter [Prevotella sp.]|nr:AbgT family transporter [Prevotella sp.]